MTETDDELLEREVQRELEPSAAGSRSGCGLVMTFLTIALYVVVQIARCAAVREGDDDAHQEAVNHLPHVGDQGSLHGDITPLMLCIRQGAIGGNACFTPKQTAEDPSHVEVKDAKAIGATGYCRFLVLRGSDKGLVGDAPCSQFKSTRAPY